VQRCERRATYRHVEHAWQSGVSRLPIADGRSRRGRRLDATWFDEETVVRSTLEISLSLNDAGILAVGLIELDPHPHLATLTEMRGAYES
jgi:hypothetical protein